MTLHLDLETALILKALQMAIHEAEGWYHESRGPESSGRVPDLYYCYERLEKHGMKTLREELAQT